MFFYRDVAQLASAPRSGRGGRPFESDHPDQSQQTFDSKEVHMGLLACIPAVDHGIMADIFIGVDILDNERTIRRDLKGIRYVQKISKDKHVT